MGDLVSLAEAYTRKQRLKRPPRARLSDLGRQARKLAEIVERIDCGEYAGARRLLKSLKLDAKLQCLGTVVETHCLAAEAGEAQS